jgi:hypothetical protein
MTTIIRQDSHYVTEHNLTSNGDWIIRRWCYIKKFKWVKNDIERMFAVRRWYSCKNVYRHK